MPKCWFSGPMEKHYRGSNCKYLEVISREVRQVQNERTCSVGPYILPGNIVGQCNLSVELSHN